MGADPPPSGLPPSPKAGAAAAEKSSSTTVRNEAPAPRALAMQSDDPAETSEKGAPMSHADLREMLRRNVEKLRAMLETVPPEE